MNGLDEHRGFLLEALGARVRRLRRSSARSTSPGVGWEIRKAGFVTFRDLAAAVPISHEVLSNIRGGAYPLGRGLRARLAELLDIREDEVIDALKRDRTGVERTVHVDAHRAGLLSALGARLELLNEAEQDDERDALALPGPMITAAGLESWAEVAAAMRCSVRTLMRIRRGADVPTERMTDRLARVLRVPPALALVALRRPHTGWRW